MMEISRHTLHERRLALAYHYNQRLDELAQMHSQGGQTAQEALNLLDHEWQQVQVQQQWAVGVAIKDSRAASLVALFPDTAKTLLWQIDTRTASQWIDEALMWVTDLKTRFRLLLMGYNLCETRLNMQRGREMLDEAQNIADALDDDHLRYEALALNANYYEGIEDYPNLLTSAEHALHLAIRLEEEEQIARGYHKMGFACIRNNQHNRAEQYLKTARESYQKLGIKLAEGTTLNVLAINAHEWGNYDQAVTYAEASLAIMNQLGRREWELVIMSNLALFLTDAGDLEKGFYQGQQALAASVEAGSRISEYTAVGALMLVCAKLGQSDKLAMYIEQAEAILHDTYYEDLHNEIEESQWILAHERGDWHIACAYAEKIAFRTTHDEIKNKALGCLGTSLIELGKLDTAADVFRRGLKLRDETFVSPRECANALAGLSYIEARRGCVDDAQPFLDRFFALLNVYPFICFEYPFTVAWNTYRAALALEDPRLPFLLKQIQQLFTTYHIGELRTSFLNQYSQRCLMNILPQ